MVFVEWSSLPFMVWVCSVFLCAPSSICSSKSIFILFHSDLGALVGLLALWPCEFQHWKKEWGWSIYSVGFPWLSNCRLTASFCKWTKILLGCPCHPMPCACVLIRALHCLCWGAMVPLCCCQPRHQNSHCWVSSAFAHNLKWPLW